MNPRNTALVLLVLAVLGAYVYWVELPREAQRAEEEKLVVLDEAAVTGITLEYPDLTIVLAKRDDTWHLTAPVEAGADATAVKNLIHVVANAKIERTLEDVEDKLASYGLEEPSTTVTLETTDGASRTALKVGETTSVGFSSYVQRGDDPNVYITAAAFRSGMKKTVKDLRDKRLLIFEDQDVRKIALTHDGETTVLERADADADWQITAPATYPADGSEARALLASARGIRAMDFVSDDADVDLGPYGLDDPRLRLTLSTGDDEATHTLLLGGDHEDEKKKEIYARRGNGATVYAVASFTLKNLSKGLGTLRDKTVLRYDAPAAVTIEVTRASGGGFTLRKGDDGWHVEDDGDGTERAPTISRFVDDLHGLKGNTIAAEGTIDLGAFGLEPPALTITVRDAEAKALGTLIGTRGSGEGENAIAYAAAAGGDIVYGMKPYVFERIDKQLADLRDAPQPTSRPTSRPTPRPTPAPTD